MSDLRLIGGDLLPPRSERRHLLSIGDLTREDVERLLATARSFSLSQERECVQRGRVALHPMEAADAQDTQRAIRGSDGLLGPSTGPKEVRVDRGGDLDVRQVGRAAALHGLVEEGTSQDVQPVERLPQLGEEVGLVEAVRVHVVAVAAG